MCLQPAQVKVSLGFGFARSSSSDGAKTYSIFLTLYKRFCADKTMNFPLSACQHDFSLLYSKRRWSLFGWLRVSLAWIWNFLINCLNRILMTRRKIPSSRASRARDWAMRKSRECSRNLWRWRQQVHFISVVYGWLKFHEIVRCVEMDFLFARFSNEEFSTYESNKPLRAICSAFAGDIRDFSFSSLGVDLLLNSCAKNSISLGWGSLSFRDMFWGWN